jgi:hypothetical protein
MRDALLPAAYLVIALAALLIVAGANRRRRKCSPGSRNS